MRCTWPSTGSWGGPGMGLGPPTRAYHSQCVNNAAKTTAPMAPASRVRRSMACGPGKWPREADDNEFGYFVFWMCRVVHSHLTVPGYAVPYHQYPGLLVPLRCVWGQRALPIHPMSTPGGPSAPTAASPAPSPSPPRESPGALAGGGPGPVPMLHTTPGVARASCAWWRSFFAFCLTALALL